MSFKASPSTQCCYSSSSALSPYSTHAAPCNTNVVSRSNQTLQKTDPRNSLASPQRGHANDIFHYVQLPLPPEIPPTKLKGVSVEQRVEQFESRAALESMLHSVGLAKGGSPLRNLEYTADPHYRHSANVRVWNETDSDYERMELRDSMHREHLYSDPSHYNTEGPNPYSDVLSGSMFSSLTLDEPLDSSVVQFTGKSGLFMTSTTPMTSSPIKSASVTSEMTSVSSPIKKSSSSRHKSGSMDSGYFEDDLYNRSNKSRSGSNSKPRLSSFSTIQSSKTSKLKSKISTFLCHTASDDVTDDEMKSLSSLSMSPPEHIRHNQALRHQPPIYSSSSGSSLKTSTDSLLSDSMYEVIKPSPIPRPSNKRSSSSKSKTKPSDIDDHLKSRSRKAFSNPAENVVQFTSKSSLLYKPKPSTKTSYTSVYHHRPALDVVSTVSSIYEVLTDNKDEEYYQMLDCYEPRKPQKSIPKKPKRRVPESERIYENL